MAADEELLRRIEAHLDRGNGLMEELRREQRLNRSAFGRQFELMQQLIERNSESYLEVASAADRFREVIAEQLTAVRGTLDLQREILLRVLDRLDQRD